MSTCGSRVNGYTLDMTNTRIVRIGTAHTGTIHAATSGGTGPDCNNSIRVGGRRPSNLSAIRSVPLQEVIDAHRGGIPVCKRCFTAAMLGNA